ncbi:MAG: hypothetical protein WBW73_01655 [Rhodoplanes sp.]
MESKVAALLMSTSDTARVRLAGQQARSEECPQADLPTLGMMSRFAFRFRRESGQFRRGQQCHLD